MTATRTKPKHSTRHIVVDERFARLLEEDFAIGAETVLLALDGEPQKQAIALCEWAARQDEPSEALVAWARKHRKGRCGRRRPPADRRHGTSPSPRGNRPGDGRYSDTPAGRGGWFDRSAALRGLSRMGA